MTMRISRENTIIFQKYYYLSKKMFVSKTILAIKSTSYEPPLIEAKATHIFISQNKLLHSLYKEEFYRKKRTHHRVVKHCRTLPASGN